MRGEYFLALPVMATLFNFLFALLILQSHHTSTHAQHQHPVAGEGLQQQQQEAGLAAGGRACVGDSQDCLFDLDTFAAQTADEESSLSGGTYSEHQKSNNNDDDEEEDPMLQILPGTDKKVYVRADIATFYGKEPGSMQEVEPDFKGQAGKFVNMSPDRVSLYWNGGNGDPVFNSNLGPFSAGGTGTFPSHQFLLTKHNNPNDVICEFTIVKGTSVYYYDPFSQDQDGDTDVARCVLRQEYASSIRQLEELSTDDLDKYRAHQYNLEFGAMYKNFTGGSEWLSMYPRNPPRHKIWRADYFGQEHTVSTTETHFVQEPPNYMNEKHPQLTIDEMRRHENETSLPLAEFREPGTLNLTLKALSCAPRAFEIRNFLSDVEVDHILGIVAKKNLARSTTGQGGNGHLSDTRTSTTTWISRTTDPLMNAVFRRAADALRLDEALMRQRHPDEHPDMPNRRKINEDLQIVHYDVGQEYTAHHDFGYPTGLPDSPARSINLCMYLNDVPAGGETAFPRWRNAETGEAIKVKPEKGKAMIFFMTNPDGNLDDLTQHAALPVIEGEKYFANLWLHDPYLK